MYSGFRLDDIWLAVVLVFAGGVFGFILGMFALMRVREMAKHIGVPVPRIPGLSQEQTFGLLGLVGAAAFVAFVSFG